MSNPADILTLEDVVKIQLLEDKLKTTIARAVLWSVVINGSMLIAIILSL